MPVRTTTIRTNSVLVVHGRGFKPPADALADITLAALRAGVERDYPDTIHMFDKASVQLAYYGDLNNEVLQQCDGQYDHVIDTGDRQTALASLKSIDARKRFGIRQYDCLPGKSALPEFLTSIVAPVCGALGVIKPVAARLSPDFCEYLTTGSSYTSAVRERVRRELCALFDADNRIMLITHGTGCMIAYDVLWQLSHDPRWVDRYGEAKVDTWVTLGAPLGDNGIRRYLLGAKGEPKSYPQNVITWHNVSAEDDYTCHDNTLADDFKKMLEQRVVSTVQDYRVYNLAVRYGKSNPHSSVGYFIHPRTSKIIADWVKMPALDTDPIYTL